MARTALKNKQNLMYSLLGEPEPVYLTDSEGNIITTDVNGTQVPVEEGFNEPVYGEPVSFVANIMPVGSESYARGNVAVPKAYGIDISEYDALILARRYEFPLTETSIVWHESVPQYKTVGNTRVVDKNSADYQVKRVASSQNITLILLNRINHSQLPTH